MRALLWCLLPVVLSTLVTASRQSDVTRLVERAIAAAGGESALAAARVLKWSASATVHTPSGSLRVAGRWIVEPPDRAAVTTWEVDKGETSARRMLVDRTTGWMHRGSERTPMPATVLAYERDQFYLYAVMRLVPLRAPDVELSVRAPGTLLIRDPRRPDVEASFDASGRLAALRTQISHPADNSDIVQEVTLEGTISASGVNWPRAIRIVQDGKPFFEMELTEFAVGTAEDITNALAISAGAQRFIRWSTSPSFLISSP